MRFKVGEQWFDSAEDSPMMVVFSQGELEQVRTMANGLTRYAIFNPDKMSKEEMEKWMRDYDPPQESMQAGDHS